jgi:hypothetical protein
MKGVPVPTGIVSKHAQGAAIVGIALTGIYLYYNKDITPSGASPLGMAYGVLGVLGILFLIFLGVRKRWHRCAFGTMERWVNGHVYLGFLTVWVVSLHTGFHFGTDIHTLAYGLLIVVVVSGLLGLIVYQMVPPRLTQHETDISSAKIQAAFNRCLLEISNLAEGKSTLFKQFAQGELLRARKVAGLGWGTLFKRDKLNAKLTKRTREFSELLVRIPQAEQEDFARLCGVVLEKTELESKMASRMRLKNLLEAWLYVHVPASIALLVAVALHIVVVRYYVMR